MTNRRSLAALLMACLMASAATVAVPAAGATLSAFAATTVVSLGAVPVGGTSSAPASFTFQENSPGAWSAGGTISVTITDAAGADTLTFTNPAGGTPSPTLSAPAALGASITAVAGNSFTVAIQTDDGVNALAFTVANLYITAASDAANGPIQATASGTIDASTYGPMSFVSSAVATNAVGLVAQSYPAGATSVVVLVRSSCPFAAVGTPTASTGIASRAGHFIIAGYDAGPTGTVAALGPSSSSEEVLSGFTPLPHGAAAGAVVTQANVPNCPSRVTALIALALSASSSTIVPGGTVTYTYTVTNGGAAALANVVVTDGACSPVRYVSGDTDGDSLLEVGETWTYTCTATPLATVTDSASASGIANGRTTVATARTTVIVTPVPAPVTLIPVSLTDSIAPGVARGVEEFGTSSVVVPRGGYVTVLVTTSPNLAGDLVQIWIKTKATGWRLLTLRRMAADGTVHYYARVNGWTALWAKFAGDAAHAPASSHGRIATNP